MKNTSVAVIVLTYNNLKDTLECLDSVSRLHYPSFETVLVDNHSTDGSFELIAARHPAIHYVKNADNLGVAGGRNSGWQYVSRNFSCDYLFFLDNDVVVHPDSLSFLVQALEAHPEVGIICGKTYTAPPSETIMSVGLKVNLYTGFVSDIGGGEKDEGQYENARYVSACGGFAFLTRDEVFRELNGLANEFNPYGWEDVDLSFRALKKGYRCFYNPRAIIYHKGCKIGRGYIPLYEKYKVKHYFLFLSRHTSATQKVTCSIIIPFRAFTAVVKLILRGKGKILVSHLSGAFETVFKKRRLKQHDKVH